MRYELTDYEWTAIRPFLPNKPRGVPHVNHWRVLDDIFWVLRSGALWLYLPETFGPYTTLSCSGGTILRDAAHHDVVVGDRSAGRFSQN